jgi:hypothetical protein
MKRFIALAALFFSATSTFAIQTRTVNCSEGQSLNLASKSNHASCTVSEAGLQILGRREVRCEGIS